MQKNTETNHCRVPAFVGPTALFCCIITQVLIKF